ncbi:MAG TPA: hypothetical protein VKF61_02815 [Candidatus Polarisedimenticolia bacterium]|nr:hypothetical protein [Candidatus Polarisedimenticolia bacterium]
MNRKRVARAPHGRAPRVLSFLVIFATALAIAPACFAAGACGMDCCHPARGLPSVTRDAECCRIESAPAVQRLAISEAAPLPTRAADACAHPVVLSAAAATSQPALGIGSPIPPGSHLAIAAVPLYILDSALLI